jgi:hypothetical protein
MAGPPGEEAGQRVVSGDRAVLLDRAAAAGQDAHGRIWDAAAQLSGLPRAVEPVGVTPQDEGGDAQVAEPSLGQ